MVLPELVHAGKLTGVAREQVSWPRVSEQSCAGGWLYENLRKVEGCVPPSVWGMWLSNGSRDLEKTLGKVPETWPWKRGFSIMSGIES